MNQDGVVNRLLAAGVYERHHSRVLRDYGAVGDRLHTWVDGVTFTMGVEQGSPVLLHGEDSYRLSMTFARACVLKGYYTQVIQLPELVQDIREFNTPQHMEPDILVVGRFFDGGYAQSPLTQWETMSVETLLLDRVDRGLMLVVQSTHPLRECAWWSNTFLEFLDKCDLHEYGE